MSLSLCQAFFFGLQVGLASLWVPPKEGAGAFSLILSFWGRAEGLEVESITNDQSVVKHDCVIKGFPGGSDGKESACNAEDPGSIPGLERFLGEGNDYPLQYFCLENSMNRGAWWATVHVVTKSWT